MKGKVLCCNLKININETDNNGQNACQRNRFLNSSRLLKLTNCTLECYKMKGRNLKPRFVNPKLFMKQNSIESY